eukprot:GEMP01007350.1.p1 GENE.GEMP01007350.1~~GEMP01007350.1.p1  ORF type:complete len:995 (+),score=246.36 GEMP01007350.1:141-3125(+)
MWHLLARRSITVVPKGALQPALPHVGHLLLDSVVRKSQELESLTKPELVQVLKDLRVLHSAPDVPANDGAQQALGEAWENIAERCEDQVRVFLPRDLGFLLETLAECNQRFPELVKAVNQHCRRIAMCFSPDEMSQCLGAYTHMRWRTKGTIAAFARRYGEILGNPKTAHEVTGRHLRKAIGIYPALGINWVPREFSKDHPVVNLWLKAANRVPSIVEDMSPRDFSVLLNAYARNTHVFAGEGRGEKTISRFFQATIKHLAPRLAMEHSTFMPRDVALLCNAYGLIAGNQLQKPSIGPLLLQPFFEAVKEHVEKSDLETWAPLDMSLVCNAFTKLDFVELEVFDAFAPHIAKRVRYFSPQSLSNIAHAYAKVQVKNEPLFDRIGDFAARTLDKFSPQGLGNLAYAFGKVFHKHDTLFYQLRDEVVYRGTVGRRLARVQVDYRFDLRSLEQLSHAFSRLHYHDEHVFFVLFYLLKNEVNRQAKYTTREAPNVSPGMEYKLDAQGLSVILTSMAKSKIHLRGLNKWAARNFFGLHKQMNTWQMVTIFSAVSRLELKHQPMFDHITKLSKQALQQMSPKALAMLLHSMSKTDMYDRTLFRQWTKQAQIHIKDFDGVDLVQIATAVSDQRYRDAKLICLLMEATRVRWHELKPGQISAVFRAYSRMRIDDPEWFDRAMAVLFEKQHDLTDKEGVNTLYSLMSLSIAERWVSGEEVPVDEPIMKRYFHVLQAMVQVANRNRHRMKYESIFQLQMLELYLRFVEPTIFEQLSTEEKDVLARARRVNVVVDDYMQSSSKMHRRISRVFTRVGLHHRSEVYIGPFMLDIVLGSKLIVEVDGPSHFFQDTNTRTTASLLKHTILEKMGYTVRHLIWQEWNQCGSHQKKLLYCASFWKDVLGGHVDGKGGPGLADVVEALEESRLEESQKTEQQKLLAEYDGEDYLTEISRNAAKSAKEKRALRRAMRMRRNQATGQADEEDTDDEGTDRTAENVGAKDPWAVG